MTEVLPDSVAAGLQVFQAAWLAGEQPDPGAFCAAHPEFAPGLRARIDDFLFVAGGLRAARPRDWIGPPVAADPAGEFAGRTLGDFHLLREIGRGGMGVVYEAEQLSLGRKVAVKVLPAHITLHPKAIQRFQREASTASNLKHPGIVEVYAVGEADGSHFFAMELVEGTPLDRRISRMLGESGENGVGSSSTRSRSYLSSACALVAKVADALQFAHQAGVIHRDVKPPNILVRESGEPVLTDFGLARNAALPGLTVTGEFAGSAYYVSPEQAMTGARQVDHRTDIYSLGVTLYELLTLRRPFEGGTSHDLLRRIVAEEPPAPRRLNPLVPRDLENICLKAMEKDPGRRYPSAGEFAADIRRFLEHRPVRARPVGPARRAWRWVCRNPAKAVAAGLLLTLVVGGPLAYAGIQLKAKRAIAVENQRARGSQMTAEAALALTNDPGIGLILADEGYRLNPSAFARRTLYSAWLASLEAGAERKTLIGHRGAVRCTVLSPDGRLLATCSDDKTTRVWDTRTWELLQVLEGHTAPVLGASFNHDASLLATASVDGKVLVWDVRTWTVRHILRGYQGPASRAESGYLVDFHPSRNELVIAGGFDYAAVIFDADSAEILHTLGGLSGHTDLVSSARYSHDGLLIATASRDRSVRLWNADGGDFLRALEGHGSHVRCASFAPGDDFVVGIGQSGEASVWKVPGGDPGQALVWPSTSIDFGRFLPDGRLFVIARLDARDGSWRPASRDLALPKIRQLDGHESVPSWAVTPQVMTTGRGGAAFFWDVAPESAPRLELKGHEGEVLCVTASSDGEWLATGSQDHTVRIWRRKEDQTQLLKVMPGAGAVEGAVFLGAGDRFASISEAGVIQVWDARTGAELARAGVDGRALTDIATCDDGSRILAVALTKLNDISALRSAEVLVWDARDLSEICRMKGMSGALSPDGRLAAAGTSSGEVWVLDLESGKSRKIGTRDNRIVSLAFDAGSRHLAAASDDTTIGVWNLDQFEELPPLRGHEKAVAGMVFTPSGAQVFSIGDNRCLIHGLGNESPRWSLGSHENTITSMAMGPHGDQAATGGNDGAVCIWDLATGRRTAWIPGHQGAVEALAFHPDGKLVLSGGNEGVVRLVSASTGEVISEIRAHDGRVSTVDFDSKGLWMLSASTDGTIVRWPVDPVPFIRAALPRPAQGLTASERRRLSIESPEKATARSKRAMIEAQAWSIIDDLRRDGHRAAEIIKAIEEDPGMSEELRAAALGLCRLFYDDFYSFLNSAWAVVKKEAEDPVTVQLALKKALTSLKILPGNAPSLQTIGVAYLRLRDLENAREYLDQADRAYREKTGRVWLANRVFQSMLSSLQGDVEEARLFLGEYESFLDKSGVREAGDEWQLFSPQAVKLLREAEPSG